jgi:hypothetical protein
LVYEATNFGNACMGGCHRICIFLRGTTGTQQ